MTLFRPSKHGRGAHSDYHFSDIRLEDWYSLYQIHQPLPQMRDVHFRDIWSMDSSAMPAPVPLGDVAGEHRLRIERNADLENADAQPNGDPLLLWEGPGIGRQPVPAAALRP